MPGSFPRHVGLAALLSALAVASPAAEIVLERSAVEKIVVQTLFTDAGRHVIQGGACYAYLDSSSVALTGGRLRIRSRLNSHLGMDVGGTCVGMAVTSWTVVSGRPAAAGGTVRLDDLRVDSVDDPTVRLVLDSGLVPSLPRAIELDVLGAVRSMLEGQGASLQTTVDAFQIDTVQVGEGRLTVKFNFKLVAR